MGWEALGIVPPTDGSVSILTKVIRKSQIAIEYAYRFQQSHPQSHVFWIYAANSTQFVQALHESSDSLVARTRMSIHVNLSPNGLMKMTAADGS